MDRTTKIELLKGWLNRLDDAQLDELVDEHLSESSKYKAALTDVCSKIQDIEDRFYPVRNKFVALYKKTELGNQFDTYTEEYLHVSLEAMTALSSMTQGVKHG